MEYYDVLIKNCNSVDSARVSLKKNSLNIKFGPNGLGKSTIAKAIVSEARGDGTLASLTPFKNRGLKVGQPQVTGISELTSALVFDEDFVSQFAFQEDEVLKNSFEIFVKTPEYNSAMKEIENLFNGIKEAFHNSPEIEQTTKDLKDLRDAFGKSNKDGSISKSSKLLKAFGRGNKIDNVPETLKPFELFIKSPSPSKWIGWQMKGNIFLNMGDICPYCSAKLSSKEQKDTALSVAKEYDAAAVNHLNTLKAVILRLGKYFSKACKENLEKIINSTSELTLNQKIFLRDLKSSIEALIKGLEDLRTISFFSLRDVDQIDEKLPTLKIELEYINKLDSEQTRSVTDPINSQLEDLMTDIGTLTGKVNIHKSKIKKTIQENQESINGFLKSAGYKYSVRIISELNSYKMKLEHEDSEEYVKSASTHLSYGEKNAFALVLFMHQVLSDNPDIVILDDPISSFDKNKKFAILNELFRGKASLRDRTTLMLTHDIEPAIDIVKSTARIFQGAHPSATFLSIKNGEISEEPIKRDDIRTFAKICKDICNKDIDDIIKAIYLRRHYEITDNTGLEYNLLASLFKKRTSPTILSPDGHVEMSPSEAKKAETKIKEQISTFCYAKLLTKVKDNNLMTRKFMNASAGYDKLQIFRIIKGKHSDDIITKFINESYHIENEYVMQLDPHKFENVPSYVIEECKRLLNIQDN